MKMKFFAALALSGLVAALAFYGVPAIADDTASGDSSGSSMQQAPSDGNSMQNQSGDSSSSQGMGGGGSSGAGASGTDDGSPDTATGDDDY